MLEIKEAIEVLKEELKIIEEYEGGEKIISNFKVKDLKEALQTILSFFSKIQSAEMPQKKSCEKGEQYWMWNSVHNIFDYGKKIGFNDCHDLWLAFYLKKMSEKGKCGEKRIEKVIWQFHEYLAATRLDWAKKNIKEIATAIAKEINGEGVRDEKFR